MCRFKSGIQFKNRNVLTTIYNDSHSDLLEGLGIEDNEYNASSKFVRVELIPPNDNIAADISEWKYNVDQDIVPYWFDLDRERYEQSFREDVKDWLEKNLTIEYVCGKPWTCVKDGEYTYHFMYGSLFSSRFGDTNNYSKSEAREKLVNSDLAKQLEEFYGDRLVPVMLDLTSLNGSKEYGVVSRDKIAIPTLDILRKFKENIPLMNEWYWTSTPNGTKETGDKFRVQFVYSGGHMDPVNCRCLYYDVRPFYITKSLDAFREYKGYAGSIEYSPEDRIYYGKVLFTNENHLVNYEAENIVKLEEEFHKAVDDYFKFCKEIDLNGE